MLPRGPSREAIIAPLLFDRSSIAYIAPRATSVLEQSSSSNYTVNPFLVDRRIVTASRSHCASTVLRKIFGQVIPIPESPFMISWAYGSRAFPGGHWSGLEHGSLELESSKSDEPLRLGRMLGLS